MDPLSQYGYYGPDSIMHFGSSSRDVRLRALGSKLQSKTRIQMSQLPIWCRKAHIKRLVRSLDLK